MLIHTLFFIDFNLEDYQPIYLDPKKHTIYIDFEITKSAGIHNID